MVSNSNIKFKIIFLLLINSFNSLPIVVLHGINDNCSGWMGQLSDNFGNRLGSYSKCIETGADISSISTSVKYQAEKACYMINQDDNFKNDFKNQTNQFQRTVPTYAVPYLIVLYLIKIASRLISWIPYLISQSTVPTLPL